MSEHIQKFEVTPSAAILIAGVLIAGAILLVNSKPPASAADAVVPAASAKVPLPSQSDNMVGSPDAPIVLVEYSDFQCPFCSMIYPTLKKVVAESNGEVAWVMREYPLYQIHPEAVPSAQAALCIADQLGDQGYWGFADTIFANQKLMNAAYYEQVAAQLGVDIGLYKSCVKSEKFSDTITAQANDAQTNGGSGTPFTVVINTKTGKQYPISGALPYAQIKAVIEAAKAGK